MTGFEVRRSTRDPLIALSVSLADEFSDRVPAGTVIRSVAQAREGLLAAGVRAGLVVAVESMTRARLHALAASRGDVEGIADLRPVLDGHHPPQRGRRGPFSAVAGGSVRGRRRHGATGSSPGQAPSP
jgi:hypothetical protein